MRERFIEDGLGNPYLDGVWAEFILTLTPQQLVVVKSMQSLNRKIRRRLGTLCKRTGKRTGGEVPMLLESEDKTRNKSLSTEPFAPSSYDRYADVATSDPLLLEAIEQVDTGRLGRIRHSDGAKRKRAERKRAERKRAERYRDALSEHLSIKVTRDRLAMLHYELANQTKTKIKIQQHRFQHRVFRDSVASWAA